MVASGSTFSVIGADVVITGDIAATADLHVDGTASSSKGVGVGAAKAVKNTKLLSFDAEDCT
jgi:hypothetical protein